MTNEFRLIGNKCDPSGHFFKITNEDENHNGFQYYDGLNVLKEEFSTKGSCVKGGLYFTSSTYIYDYLSYGIYLRDITLPSDDPDLKMVEDESGGKWRANKIILGEKRDLSKIEAHEYLISQGAPLKSAHRKMLKIAKGEENFELAKYLMSNSDISHKDIHKVMIKIAIREENLDLAFTLTDQGVPENKAQNVILKITIMKKDWDSAKSLIKSIESIKDDVQELILESENIDLIKLILDCNLVFGVYRHRIFNFAIEKESLDLIKSCHKSNYPCEFFGEGALFGLARKGNVEIFRFLVENGTSYKSKCGSLFRIACEKGHLDLVKYLVDLEFNGPESINDCTCEAIKNGHLETAKFLISRGAVVDYHGNYYNIIEAIKENSLEKVKFWIESGLKFRCYDEQALCIASEEGHLDIVKYLVEKGSNLKSKNNMAIYRAVSNNHLDVVKFLHEHGAKIRVKNNLLVHTAKEKGYVDLVKYLIENGAGCV